MTPQDPSLDPLLEQALSEIRDEPIDPAMIEAAAQRVQAHLSQHTTLHTCADFQALMPDYRAGKLSPARALLLKDHTHECVACYKALKAKSAAPGPRSLAPLAARPAFFRWALAATVVAAAGLAFWAFGDRLRPAYSGPEAVVESADGLIYRVSDTGTVPLVRGVAIVAGADIRTARDAHAILRLRDGSHVEMRERTGVSVSERGHDLTVGLDHGAIIVQAAKRKAGHLYVAARDCRVAVTGTVFSVNSGLKGSRVTVIQGTVLVAQNRHESVLHAGDQVSTSSAVGSTPAPLEISWSHNADAYVTMLNAVTALNVKLDQDRFPALRYTSNLMTMVPAQTVVYASIPNLSQALTEVQQVFVPKIQQNATLSQWWQQNKLDQVIADMSTMSGYLGNEMVVAAALNSSGHPGQPVILAELKQPGFAAFAQSEIAKLSSGANAQKLRIVTDPSTIGTIPQGECVLLVLPNLVALSPDAAILRQIAAGTPTTFAATEFGSQITAAYGAGVGLLFAADVQAMAPESHGHAPSVQYFMVQQTGNAGAAETRAALIFNGQRTGVASWLAAPAPLGALDFISPQATLAWAAAVKQPTAIIDEIMAMQQSNPAFQQHLADVQALLGVDLRNDLAAALGGEVAMAQDGPLLPLPSWKVVVEVYDPVKLQSTIQKLVDAANASASLRGSPAVQLQQSTANGRTYYTLSSPAASSLMQVCYTYTDGYLLAGSSQALLDAAIQNRSGGITLPRSATFTALIPHDQYANFSAMVYYNASTLSPLLEQFSQQPAAQELAANLKPTLIAAYGENDRITFATNGSLFTTFGNMSLLRLLEKPGTHVH
ncbi:MAG TPA: FecR domain-containing protein [Bryobacteraceae bacterium]|nr:FecR domain-containing protein [Bryobacteraceae bacterium]